MSAKRYEPFNDIRKSFDLVNSIINTINEESKSEEHSDFTPKVNTRETEKSYYLEVELSGVKKEDVDINVDGNVLSISGERKVRAEVKAEDYQKIESRYGLFSRSFTLPEKVDIENIEAGFENGILEISIPKLKVDISSKKIEIK
ncbi:MAG: Heat shock protein, Hsp20 family [uncultured Sulfurovum sp.]|uniref:Heat shock protein, Hsp20 family n=1 Tax=uncultured Sulfurovum sp. TaxID=269237 RepID=A0A6S6S4G3_9BACT|nr:MAG: Heat shock protein, Hsp20 family [uncultured Sulfurovum sp.]